MPGGRVFRFGDEGKVEYLEQVRDDLQLESEKLARSWTKHDPAWLRDYLVAGVEDPRLNVQSILSRHFLIRAVIDEPLEAVMVEEYRFAAALSWLTSKADLATDPEARAATLDALRRGSDNAEGLEIPPFISSVFKALPSNPKGVQVPHYVEKFLSGEPGSALLDTFAQIWSGLLPGSRRKCTVMNQDARFLPVGVTPPKDIQLSVLEPACGSANDYRFFNSFGIAPMLNYTGFDLCEKNVENARLFFPGTKFIHGNVFEITAPDKSFDLCVVHDLFEHLTPAGIEGAVAEVCRVSRQGMCVGFFQMAEIPDNIIRPVDDYYWNLLSVSRMMQLFVRHGFAAQVIHVDTFLSQHTGAPGTHNSDAYTFVLHST